MPVARSRRPSANSSLRLCEPQPGSGYLALGVSCRRRTSRGVEVDGSDARPHPPRRHPPQHRPRQVPRAGRDVRIRIVSRGSQARQTAGGAAASPGDTPGGLTRRMYARLRRSRLGGQPVILPAAIPCGARPWSAATGGPRGGKQGAGDGDGDAPTFPTPPPFSTTPSSSPLNCSRARPRRGCQVGGPIRLVRPGGGLRRLLTVRGPRWRALVRPVVLPAHVRRALARVATSSASSRSAARRPVAGEHLFRSIATADPVGGDLPQRRLVGCPARPGGSDRLEPARPGRAAS
jgi:hypothetical protein